MRGRFRLRGTTEYAHRAAWLLFRGPIPAGQVVRHVRCDDSLCVNPQHLALGTAEDNAHDRAVALPARPFDLLDW